MKSSIKAYSYEALKILGEEEGWPRFRVDQLFSWLYEHGVSSYDEMTNLPKSLRHELAEHYPVNFPSVITKQVSSDESRKYLVRYEDGACVETVGIPSRDNKRLSVCVSTQVGCAMGCVFCATGKQGFVRDLLPGEIVDQVMIVQKDFGVRVSNVVVMGQGEPFLNYYNTLSALKILNHPKGLAIGARHITISTCGIIPGIKKLSEEAEQFTLAISLHAAVQPLRDMLMPGLKNYPLERLRTALREYALKTGRRITFEYIMIKDMNDSPECLTALKTFCKNLPCHINLLFFNDFGETSFSSSSRNVLDRWVSELAASGIEATVRDSRGSDIAGACGQLNTKASEL